MRFIKHTLLWGSVICGPLFAVPTTLNSEKVLSFTVANKGITRISIDQDRIVDTFVEPQEATAAIKNNRGHLYVSGQRNLETLYISLITKSGSVQDIKLTFHNKPAQPIWLKKPLEVAENKTPSALETVSQLAVFCGEEREEESKKSDGEPLGIIWQVLASIYEHRVAFHAPPL